MYFHSDPGRTPDRQEIRRITLPDEKIAFARILETSQSCSVCSTHTRSSDSALPLAELEAARSLLHMQPPTRVRQSVRRTAAEVNGPGDRQRYRNGYQESRKVTRSAGEDRGRIPGQLGQWSNPLRFLKESQVTADWHFCM
jgi:hypothetical protein